MFIKINDIKCIVYLERGIAYEKVKYLNIKNIKIKN
jgi:hypothetical protein